MPQTIELHTRTPRLINLNCIVDTNIHELQMRESIDHTHVDDLKESLDQLPPITCYSSDGSALYIADGWHRYLAHKLTGKKQILATVHPGGMSAAFRHALGANAEHNALRRSNKDKRKAVLACLKSYNTIFGEGEKVKNVSIAEVCKVTEGLVRKIRKELEDVSTVDSPANPSSSEPPAQIDFFARLNESYKPVALGLQEILRHTYFLEPSVPKTEKIQSLEAIERDLAQQRQAIKDLRARIEAQEESSPSAATTTSTPAQN